MIEPAMAVSTLVIQGFDTGLHGNLLPPAFFGALWSLKRSPEASVYFKVLHTTVSTLAGGWFGYAGAIAITAAVPSFFVRALPGLASVSPEVLKYGVALMIGYTGLALVDRWLFPQAPAKPGAEA